jgi:hypothetical protein
MNPSLERLGYCQRRCRPDGLPRRNWMKAGAEILFWFWFYKYAAPTALPKCNAGHVNAKLKDWSNAPPASQCFPDFFQKSERLASEIQTAFVFALK